MKVFLVPCQHCAVLSAAIRRLGLGLYGFVLKVLIRFYSYAEARPEGALFSRSEFAPVAQLDRATDYEFVDWGFESLQAHQNKKRGHRLGVPFLFCMVQIAQKVRRSRYAPPQVAVAKPPWV